MALFYAVPLQATPATKNHQADYPPAIYWPFMFNFLGVGVVIIKHEANLSSIGTGLPTGTELSNYSKMTITDIGTSKCIEQLTGKNIKGHYFCH